MKRLFLIAFAGCLLFFGPAYSKDKYPDVTADGLTRVERENLDAVYQDPEADFAGYSKIMIADCQVSFRKNWQRDQNRDRRLTDRVDAEDMDRIRMDMAKRFNEIFAKELQADGALEVVDAAGDDVLLLRPQIVDLDLFAPDVNAPNRTRTFTTSAGRMTLKMELVDSTTGSLVGRVIDRRRARENTEARIANSVTNRVEMDRIMRSWARILRDSVGEPR
jgi:hypothetical protein